MEPEAQPPTRRNGRVVVFTLLSLIAVTVVSALVFWFRGREPSGAIQRVVALGERTAVVVRKGYRQRDYVHLTVRDLTEGQRWKMALWSMLEDSEPLVRGGLVTLRVRDQLGRPETHAFRLADGTFAWRAARVMRGPHERTRGASVLGASRLFECTGGREAEVFALDPANGHVSFHVKRRGGDGPVHAVPVGDGVIVDLGDGSLVRIDARGGATELGHGSACAMGDGFVAVMADGSILEAGPTSGANPVLAGFTIAMCSRARLRDVVVLSGTGGTRVLARDGTTGAFRVALSEPIRLVTKFRVPTARSVSTIPMLLEGNRFVVLDLATGRATPYMLTPGAELHGADDVATAVLGEEASVLVRSGTAIGFLPSGEARVVELEGGPTTPVIVSLRGSVAFLARGEGMVSVDFAKRAVVGAHGPLRATFDEGGLTRITYAPR